MTDPPPPGHPPRVPVAAAVAAGMVFLVLLRPIHDVDIFWQLKLGELTLANRGPVPAEPFAATHLGEPLPPVAWLAQAVYAGARLAGGWPAVRVFDAVVWVGGFWAAAVAARRAGAGPPAVVLAAGVGFVVALPYASLRPQSFAVLGFGLLLALLRAGGPPGRTVAAAAGLFVVWQNLHPSVAVAAGVLAATAAVGWGRFAAGVRPRPPWTPTALALVAVAATLATPAGVGLYPVAADNAEVSRAAGVGEWRPVWDPVNRDLMVPTAAAAVVAGWVVARGWRKVDGEEAAPAAVLLILSLTASRFVVFWGLAVIPVLARCRSPEAVPDGPPRPGPGGRWGWVVGPALVAAAAGLAGLVRPTHFDAGLPLDGLARLGATGAAGTVYCDPAWGGPLIDAGYPGRVVAFDGRFYRYTPEEWERYAAVTRGELGPDELERWYRPAAYFLHPVRDGRLVETLRAHPGWREVFADATCVVFVRAGSG